MVEEATGVSMYEAKKKSTQIVIEKKDLALRNIDSLINETIQPKLEQLTKEQSGLLEYQKVSIELEQLTKVYTAWQFLQYQSLSEQTESKIKERKDRIDEAKLVIDETEKKVKEIENKIKDLEKQKDLEFGGKLSALEEDLKEAQMSEAKLSGDLNLKKDSILTEVKKRKQIEKIFKDDCKMMTSKEKDYNKLKEIFDKLEEARVNDEKAVEQAEKDFEAIVSGLSRDADGQAAATLADQLMQAKRDMTEAVTEATKTEMKLKHCKKELATKKDEAKVRKGNYDQDLKSVQKIESDVATLKQAMQKVDFNEEVALELSNERDQLRKDLDHYEYEANKLENRLPQIKFDYKLPHPHFNVKDVLGVVCSLFKVKDPSTYTALEVAAGGRLYNVVVKTEEVAKQILERGQPKRRCTLLPLDRIRGKEMEKRILKDAEKLVGKENVWAAIDMIDFDPSLKEAMKYVFGDTLVCSNMDCAKKVTFANHIQKRTVTLDGEVFDPSGTLSGGAIGQKGTTLAAIAEFKEKKDHLKSLKLQFSEVEAKLNSMKSSQNEYLKCKESLELKSHELKLLQENLKQTNQALLLEEISNLESTIEESIQLLKELALRKEKAEKKVNELQIKMKDSESIRKKELKEAEVSLNNCKKAAEKTRKAAADRRQEVYCLKLEIDELKKSSEASELQIKEVNEVIAALEAESNEINSKVEEAKIQTRQVMDLVKEQKKLLNEHSVEITKLSKQKDGVVKNAEDKKLIIKKYQHEITQIETEGQEASKAVRHLLKKHSWIEDEKHLFGDEVAGYGFDANTFKPEEVENRLKQLQSTKATLAKTVNMRANIMLGDKEKEYDDLSKKRQIIENDRKNLILYMEDVDHKKRDALHNAHEKINKDFGNIFSTLLPGTNAKLSAPDGKTVLDGLEVRVAFGDVWKESLTELSGGQRSLVALSLILALLLYNPAPIYILDEVDAALDQSHTQNIGIMIKKHFTNSQVIKRLSNLRINLIFF